MQKNLKIQIKYQEENEAGELVEKKEWLSLNKTLLRFMKWTSFRSNVPPEDK